MTKGYRKGGLEGEGSDQRDTGRGDWKEGVTEGYRKGGLEGGGSDKGIQEGRIGRRRE